MKAILEFDLPEDYDAFKSVSVAGEFRDAVYHFSERLRALDKHGNSYQNTDEAVRIIREIFMEIVGEYLE
jgi:hypothetical protein